MNRLCFFVLFFFLFVFIAFSQQVKNKAVVKFYVGTVQYQPDKLTEWRPVKLDLYLGQGDRIKTALNSVLSSKYKIHSFVVNPNPSKTILNFLKCSSQYNMPQPFMNNLISVPFSTFATRLKNKLSPK